MSQQDTVGTHRTTIITVGGSTNIIYHNTAVVSFNQIHIILNSGGWRTVTTKTRMNQASHQFDLGYSVYQRDYEWFVDFNDSIKLPFKDGMVLKREEK